MHICSIRKIKYFYSIYSNSNVNIFSYINRIEQNYHIFTSKKLYFSKKIQEVRYRKLHLKTNKINNKK